MNNFLNQQKYRHTNVIKDEEENDSDVNESESKHETKTDVVPSYNEKTFLSMESKQFTLIFYKNIILPCQCICKIFSFLSFEDEISLLKCGEIANQTIKYKYYKFHNHVNIIKLTPVEMIKIKTNTLHSIYQFMKMLMFQKSLMNQLILQT